MTNIRLKENQSKNKETNTSMLCLTFHDDDDDETTMINSTTPTVAMSCNLDAVDVGWRGIGLALSLFYCQVLHACVHEKYSTRTEPIEGYLFHYVD